MVGNLETSAKRTTRGPSNATVRGRRFPTLGKPASVSYRSARIGGDDEGDFRARGYQRGKLMLTGTEKDFWREAEFALYMGKRPAWKLVGSLSLNEKQQTDSAWLSCYIRPVVRQHVSAKDSRTINSAADLEANRSRQNFHDNAGMVAGVTARSRTSA